MPELLTVRNLVKHFPVRRGFLGRSTAVVHAVDDVSFSLGENETLGLVGESGCGKTTTGFSILRLIEPTSGEVWFQGENILALAPERMRHLRRHMQIVFKEIPPAKIEAGKVYLFFPHVIKGQPANMPMLKRLMELKATLVDYERIVDEKNRRLIFFGRHAGLAGMVNTIWSLGKRLEVEGIPSAFRRLKQARTYADLSGAQEDLGRIAARIAADGVPEAIHPLVVGFTGYGNVSQGAQEILDLLSFRTITPAELKTVAHDRARDARVIYKVVFKEADLVEPLEGGKAFDLDDYYRRGAGSYRSVFNRYLNDLSVLVNCIYWDERYPQLLTLPECRTLWAPGRSPKLKVN